MNDRRRFCSAIGLGLGAGLVSASGLKSQTIQRSGPIVWTDAIALQNYTLSGGLNAAMPSGSTSSTLNLPDSNGIAQ